MSAFLYLIHIGCLYINVYYLVRFALEQDPRGIALIITTTLTARLSLFLCEELRKENKLSDQEAQIP